MLDALAAGECNAKALAGLARTSLRCKTGTLEQAFADPRRSSRLRVGQMLARIDP